MITINRDDNGPIIVEEATTVKEAVEYAGERGISLEGAHLDGANLSGITLRRVNLKHAHLCSADLSNTRLDCVDLEWAQLVKADLTSSNLLFVNLNHANLTEAKFIDVQTAYLSIPINCGILRMYGDAKLFCQLMYYTLTLGQKVKDKEVQRIVNDPKNIAIANQFYDTELHGELKPVKDSLYRDSRGRFTKKTSV